MPMNLTLECPPWDEFLYRCSLPLLSLFKIQSEPDRVHIFNFNKGAPTLRSTSYSSPGMGISLHLHLRKPGVGRGKGLAHAPQRVSGSWRTCLLAAIFLLHRSHFSLCARGNVFTKINVHTNGILMTRQQTLKLRARAWDTAPNLDLVKKTAQLVAGAVGLELIRDWPGQPESMGTLIHFQNLAGPTSERLGGRGLVR